MSDEERDDNYEHWRNRRGRQHSGSGNDSGADSGIGAVQDGTADPGISFANYRDTSGANRPDIEWPILDRRIVAYKAAFLSTDDVRPWIGVTGNVKNYLMDENFDMTTHRAYSSEDYSRCVGLSSKADCAPEMHHFGCPCVSGTQFVNCRCGFYALAADNAEGIRQLSEIQDLYGAKTIACILEVELGGTVVIGQLGYRSRWQRCMRVMFPDSLATLAAGEVTPDKLLGWRQVYGTSGRPIIIPVYQYTRDNLTLNVKSERTDWDFDSPAALKNVVHMDVVMISSAALLAGRIEIL